MVHTRYMRGAHEVNACYARGTCVVRVVHTYGDNSQSHYTRTVHVPHIIRVSTTTDMIHGK